MNELVNGFGGVAQIYFKGGNSLYGANMNIVANYNFNTFIDRFPFISNKL